MKRHREPVNPHWEELFARLRTGDAEAMMEIAVTYYPALIAFITRYWRGSPDDVAQTSLMKLWIQHRIAKGPGFLFSIAGFEIKTRIAGVIRECEVLLEYSALLRAAPAPSTESQIDLGLLQPGDREIVELRYYDALSRDEIREITGRSVGAIRCAEVRALRTLGKAMKASPGKKSPAQGSGSLDTRPKEPATPHARKKDAAQPVRKHTRVRSADRKAKG